MHNTAHSNVALFDLPVDPRALWRSSGVRGDAPLGDVAFYNKRGTSRYVPIIIRGQTDDLLSDHELYERLGGTLAERHHAYREMFRSQLSEIDIHDIRTCLVYNYPLGNDRFREQVETMLGKRVGQRQRGRPPKHVDAPK